MPQRPFRPRRYQNGAVELVETALGPAWFLRYTDAEGKRPRLRIGLKADLPTKSKASRAAQPLRDQINGTPTVAPPPRRTFADVIARYEAEEMPARFSTRAGYMKLHRLYLMPNWGRMAITEIEASEVRSWLRGLTRKPTAANPVAAPLSTRTKGHIHSHMKNLFKFAMLWRWLPTQVNPLSLFSLEGSTKRARAPRVISPAQFRQLLDHYRPTPAAGVEAQRMQVMLIGAYLLGLRKSELFALQWGDFDHLGATVTIRRAIVQGRVGPVKTERSNAPLPLAKFVADTFLHWRAASDLRDDQDWVFASPYLGGELPLDSNNIQANILVHGGRAIGLPFNLGFHTLRHSYKSLLDRISGDATLKRDLMRHADVHTTMQVYGEVEMDRLREVNSAAVTLALTDKDSLGN